MQQQLIGELTAHAEFGVTPSYSIDEALMRYFHGTQPMQLDGRFKKFLQSIAVDYAVKGTLHRNGAARTVQVSIVNAKNNYVEFACDSAVHDDADVPVVLHALAANVVGYFSVSAELSKDVSMRMWVADASKSIDAQICFLRGFQEIANGGSAGERMYDALSYDSTFVSARVWLVSSLMNKGRKEEAREQYRILLGQERAASLPARVMIRYAGAMIDENPDEMARNLENALEFAPGNYVLQTNLAHVKHVLRGQYREALAMIRPLIDVRWAYPGLYGMAAKCYYQLGQLDSAWMAIERHRPASDNDMDCLAVSAVLNERAARTAAALSEVARACNVFPLLRVPLSGAAMTAVSEQSRSASEHCVRRMRQLFRRRGVTTDVALCDVSSYLFEYGEPVLAERYVREALVMAPNSVECLEQLGLVLRKQGNIAEAAACFAMLLTLDPKSEAARLGLADIAWTSGDLAEASEQYRALLSGNASAISIDTATARLARAGSSAAHRSSRDR
jgi:tetratricopeptide (TPR) repeat protein